MSAMRPHMPKSVQIGPAGPPGKGVKCEGQYGLFYLFFIEFLARLWRSHFKED